VKEAAEQADATAEARSTSKLSQLIRGVVRTHPDMTLG